LDAYGDAKSGSFQLALNGRHIVDSVGGVIVEPLEIDKAKQVIEITGRFDVDHFVRIIRTRNPLDQSEILHSVRIAPSGGVSSLRIPLSSHKFENVTSGKG
jgi:hypothetical protein